MSQLIFGGLLTTSTLTAPIVGIVFIALFAIVGVMVCPDYDGMNAPALGDSKKQIKIDGYLLSSSSIKFFS
tara:strand:- start:325 stop:537 length:213 start_codon:yes stop_codon:yes gene_type:complete